MSMNKPDEHRGPEYSVQAEEAWARHSGEKAQGRVLHAGTALPGPDHGGCIRQLTELSEHI